jgi:hypothetical protein
MSAREPTVPDFKSFLFKKLENLNQNEVKIVAILNSKV